MGASVQFYGKASVMQAATNLNCSCWAIFIAGRLFCKYEQDNVADSLAMLEKNIDLLEQSNSNGIYTIKFFECEEGKAIKIKENTICDAGSFNFKLSGGNEMIAGNEGLYNPYGMYSQMKALQDEVKQLKEELRDTEVEPEGETLGSALIGLVKRPEELAIFVNTVRSAIGLPVQNLGMISGIRTGNAETITEEQRLERLATTMDALEKADPDLLTHLEKLSKMAKENPGNFQTLLSMLGK